MDEYLDFSFQAKRFDGICKYKSEKEIELYSLVVTIQNNIFNKGTLISDINDLIKRAVAILKIINEQREVMFKVENTINSKVAMRNDKMGTGERIDALVSLEKSKKKYDVSDMYDKRDLLFRAIKTIKSIELIRPLNDEDSFDASLYKEYCDGLAEVDVDLYFRMLARDKRDDLTRYVESHDYNREYTMDDVDELSNPVVVGADVEDEHIETVEDFNIEFDDEEIDEDLGDEPPHDTSKDEEPEEDIDSTFVFTDEKKSELVKNLVDYAEDLIKHTEASEDSKSMMVLDINGFINDRLDYWQKTVKSEDELLENISYFENAINKKIVDNLGEPKDKKTVFVDKIKDIRDKELEKVPEDHPMYEEFVKDVNNYVNGTISLVDALDFEKHGDELLSVLSASLEKTTRYYLTKYDDVKGEDEPVVDVSEDIIEDSTKEDDKVIVPDDYEEETIEEDSKFERFPFGGVKRIGEQLLKDEDSIDAPIVVEDEEEIDEPIKVEDEDIDTRALAEETQNSEDSKKISDVEVSAALEDILSYADKIIDNSPVNEEDKQRAREIVKSVVSEKLKVYQTLAIDEREFLEDVEICKGSIGETINKYLIVKDEEIVDIPEDVPEELTEEPDIEDIPEDVVVEDESVQEDIVDIPEDVVVEDEAEQEDIVDIPEDVVVEDEAVQVPIIEPVQEKEEEKVEIKTGGRIGASEGHIYYLIFEKMINTYGSPSKENFDNCVEAIVNSDNSRLYYGGEGKESYDICKNEDGYYAIEYKKGKEESAFEISWDRYKRFIGYTRAPQEMKEYKTYPDRKIQQQEPAVGTKLFSLNVDAYMVLDQDTQRYLLRLKTTKKLADSPEGTFSMPGEEEELTSHIDIPVYVEGGEPITIQLLRDEVQKRIKI